MRYSFEDYQQVADKVLNLLTKNDMNTRGDISIILKMLMLFPYQLSDGTYVYNFENYKSFEDLPDEAQSDLTGSMFWQDPNCFDEENEGQ